MPEALGELQLLQAWGRSNTRHQHVPSVADVVRTWQHGCAEWARGWQSDTLIEQSWLSQSKPTLRRIEKRLATTDATNDQLQLETHRRMQKG